MADTLATDLLVKIGWVFVEALDLSNVGDNSNLEYKKSMTDGTSADQADKIWHDRRTLATGTNDDLDMTALANTIFGTSVPINFAKVSAIMIKNLSTTAGDELKLDSSVANAFTGPFNGSTSSKIEIGADSVLFLSSKKDSWTVTAGTGDILRITNSNAGSVSYDIVIVGRSA